MDLNEFAVIFFGVSVSTYLCLCGFCLVAKVGPIDLKLVSHQLSPYKILMGEVVGFDLASPQ